MAAATLLVAGTGVALTTYSLSLSTGALTLLANCTANGATNPTWAAFTPDGAYAVVVNELFTGSGGLGSFSYSASTGYTAVGSLVPSNSIGTVHAVAHPSLNWVVSSSYAGNSAAVYPFSATTGALSAPTYVWSPGTNAHQVVFDASGDYLFIPCLGSNYIAQYTFDASTGAVAPNAVAPVMNTPPGSGPRHMAFHPSMPVAYLVLELSVELYVLSYNPSTGTFAAADGYRLLPPGFLPSNQSGAEVVVSPSGGLVFASVRGISPSVNWNGVTSWLVQSDGSLVNSGFFSGNGEIDYPRSIALHSSGQWMAVANQHANSVTILTVGATNGSLAYVNTYPVAMPPFFVGFIPGQ